MQIIDTEKEKLALKKMNERLRKFNTKYYLRWIGSNECHMFSNIEICGSCLGRRHWDNMVQLVNGLDYYTFDRNSYIDDLYGAFYNLASKSLDELLVKLDINDI